MTHARDALRLKRTLYPGYREEPRCPHTYDMFEDTTNMSRELALLKRLEWVNGICPECGAAYTYGHNDGCELNTLLSSKENTVDEELIEQIAKIINPIAFTPCDSDDEAIRALLKKQQNRARERARQVTTLLWEHWHAAAKKVIEEA